MIFKKLAISISNTFKTSFSVKSVILTYAGKKKNRFCESKFPAWLRNCNSAFYREMGFTGSIEWTLMNMGLLKLSQGVIHFLTVQF